MQLISRLCIALVLSGGVAFAEDKPLREMSTDRPDKTESPYTVDKGHYQVEMSVIDYSYDSRNVDKTDTRVDGVSIAPINLKAGIADNMDVQFVFNPYVYERTKDAGTIERKNGFGDTQVRLKVNMWGNDEGKTAFAVMPFVKLPTNQDNLGNDDVEGGVILPLAVSLPYEWNMGLMSEFDFNNDPEHKGRLVEYINSITFSHAIVGDLNGYVEFFSSFNHRDKRNWVGTVDTGLTYGLTEDIQLDAGVNIGVTRAADDFNPFCGISVRY